MMVRLIDLEEEEAELEAETGGDDIGDDDARPNPNVGGFSAALTCYP